MIEVAHRTEDFPPAERFERWREWMGSTHAPVDLSSEHAADYHARIRILRLGAVTVWPSTLQPLLSRRTAKLIRRADPETYNLTLVLEGTAGASWNRQEAEYGPYDLHSQSSSQPCTVQVGRPGQTVRCVGVEIPKDLLALPRKSADRATGRPLSARKGVGALLAGFVTGLIADTAGYRAADGPRLGAVLADLASALFAHSLDAGRSLSPEAHRRTLTLSIRAFINRNLQNPNLTPQTVAAAHQISTSYLYRLFQDEDVTVGALIRHQRLERARQDLADPAQYEIPVRDLAARWGFTHHSAFTRAFRSAYGTSPSDYREAMRPPR
ncbi:helix-turn-helix domain-containing protein [Actinomadura sp. LD22]|uniref:Helix-turn-helix domain-containing protein n=1 Tax=Actinomadura physcomitrii TaxID=2650748 RepID=A0A6I4MEG4_9ACTN|nr:helix-turn-helix domain-containing protein [Actinomadura physcomitrii]MWA02935.1 helix-turn-helix domain-containing protein [Actinomadura physcomitrii]